MPQQHRLALVHVNPLGRGGSSAREYNARNRHRNIGCTIGPMEAQRLLKYVTQAKTSTREVLRTALNEYLNRVTGTKLKPEKIGKYAVKNDVGLMQLIHEIEDDPGVSRNQLATRIIGHDKWTRSCLERLEREGLVRNLPTRPGGKTRWRLTRSGKKVADGIKQALKATTARP